MDKSDAFKIRKRFGAQTLSFASQPARPLKASQLARLLEQAIAKFGDLPVTCDTYYANAIEHYSDDDVLNFVELLNTQET